MRVMERMLFPSTIIPTICARFSVLRRFMMDTVYLTAQAQVKRKMQGAIKSKPCHHPDLQSLVPG